MLFLAETILKTAGFKYDEVEETWVMPVRLRPVVTVECDEDTPYTMEAILEVHAVLEAHSVTYGNVSLNGRFVSLVGLTAAQVAAVA